MIYLLIISTIIIFIGFELLWLIDKQRQKYGVLLKNRIYSDTTTSPGEILYAKTLKLSGKPDYLIKDKNMIIPVEVKTGYTPISPYVNHTMQLMAYCLLVEENFGIRPTGGYLRYPNKEFKIAYTDEAKESLKQLVAEVLHQKQTNQEQNCNHKEHYFKIIS